MRDWSLDDPGYSPNDAGHPRNRPPGGRAHAARAAAGRRDGSRPRVGRPGHLVPAAEKRALFERVERLRDEFYASRGLPHPPPMPTLASLRPPIRPGYLTSWGW